MLLFFFLHVSKRSTSILHCMTAYTNVWDCVLIIDTSIVV